MSKSESAPSTLADLEHVLIGGERKWRRREVAKSVGVSLLSARKLWRALGFASVGDEEIAFTDADAEALERGRVFRLFGADLHMTTEFPCAHEQAGRVIERRPAKEAHVDVSTKATDIGEASSSTQTVGQLSCISSSTSSPQARMRSNQWRAID